LHLELVNRPEDEKKDQDSNEIINSTDVPIKRSLFYCYVLKMTSNIKKDH
jgi:hypothetical protein